MPSTPSYSQPSFQQPSYSAPAPSYSAGGGGYSSNPYAASGYGAGGYSGNYSSGSRNWQYMVLGIIFIIFGVLLVIGILLNIVGLVMVVAMGNLQNVDGLVLTQRIVSVVVSIPIAYVYISGGVSFTRQTGLPSAKAVAVIACIPCFNCLILTPFGIWAAILAFGDAGRQDFNT